MHGGRELIYEPPTPEEGKQGQGNQMKGTVTEFKRPGSNPAVQEDPKSSTVIPFRVRNDRDTSEDARRKASSKRAQAPKAIDEC